MLLLLLSAFAQQLPSVESAVDPRVPEEAIGSLPASVQLELTIDPDGRVDNAVVTDSAGPALDAAALDAVRAYRFVPGKDVTGTPVWSTVVYQIDFRADRVPPLRIEGTIRLAGTREPGAGLTVRVESDQQVRYATADEEGEFRFVGLDAGRWTLIFDDPAFAALSQPVTVTDGKVVTLTLNPKLTRPWDLDTDQVSETVVVEARPVAVEVSERALSSDELRILPGTGGDVVKAIQNLPGVARPPFNIGQLIIRGTAPEDSAYYLDGARLPAVFHFAGLSTVVNGDLLSEVALLSGNYGVKFGRTLGGVVELRTDPALPERSSGYVSVDVLQATAFVEQKVGDRTALTVSGRRSYIDTVLGPILSSGSTTFRAPRYYDLQVRALHKTDQGNIEAAFLLSDDTFAILGDDEDPDAVSIGFTDRFQKARVRWTHRLDNGVAFDWSVLAGPESRTFSFGKAGSAREVTTVVSNRFELSRGYQGGWGAWKTGVDLYTGTFTYKYQIDGFGVAESGAATFVSPSPYLEPSVRTGPLEVTAGLRVDPWIVDEGYMTVAVDPRLVGRIDAARRTTIELAGGQFSQFPTIRQSIDSGAGNPDLGPQRSLQFSAGIEQGFGDNVSLELTGFHSRLRDLVVGREDAFRFFTGPPPSGPLDTDPYANDGTGRITGAEMLFKWQNDRTVAWVAATLSRSTRTKRPGQESTVFVNDQPLILNALISHQLPKRWRLGARVRYGSGNPYTPATNRVFDLRDRAFGEVFGTETSRLPSFFSLDVRVDKEFTFRKWAFTAYLDLQNATNRQNFDAIGYTDDLEAEEPIAGLPLLPAFGLKAAW